MHRGTTTAPRSECRKGLYGVAIGEKPMLPTKMFSVRKCVSARCCGREGALVSLAPLGTGGDAFMKRLRTTGFGDLATQTCPGHFRRLGQLSVLTIACTPCGRAGGTAAKFYPASLALRQSLLAELLQGASIVAVAPGAPGLGGYRYHSFFRHGCGVQWHGRCQPGVGGFCSACQQQTASESQLPAATIIHAADLHSYNDGTRDGAIRHSPATPGPLQRCGHLAAVWPAGCP